MQNFGILASLAFLLAFAVVFPLYLIHQHVGSPATRQRRKAEILQSFDGRPEVVVRATGTGMSSEETIWLARQHGYEFWQWETYNRTGLHMRMRRIQLPSAPPGSGYEYYPAATGYTSSQPDLYPAFNGHELSVRPMTSAELQAVRRQISKVRNPWSWSRLATILSVAAAGVGLAAVIDLISGHSFVAPACIAGALLSGAVSSFAAGLVVARRKAGEVKHATDATTPPSPGIETR
ncbi:hypothetical protein [Streptomyces sp. CT34]|uniref:hypothetical protein n=1 Tax=Streptomyces sp. CT34 TaxID=1553907 RepID=UPI0012FEC196|nr:hypothetical protein [Streptomyces sp. CT34]